MNITITMGKAGRFVLPKALRDSLGIREGSRLRIEAAGGRFEAVPDRDDTRIEMQAGFPVILGGPPRKKGDIVRAIKATRNEQDDKIASRRRK